LKKFTRFFRILLIVFLSCVVLGVLYLFTTPWGYKTREFAASIILSSQHRDLAKFTLLDDIVLKKIAADIDTPKYVNVKPPNDSFATIVDRGSTDEESPSFTTSFSKEDLIVSIDDVEKSYGDHYFKGKLLTVSNPLNVKISTSKGSQGRGFGEQLPIIAKREGAIAATNANGFYDPNGVGNGGTAIGTIIEDGVVKNTPGSTTKSDYVAGFTANGFLITGKYSIEDLQYFHVKQAASFRPQLIANGQKMITEGDGGWGYGPRTIIAQKKDGTVFLLVIDGRQSHSIGASLKDLQDYLYDKGAINAMAMDGGSSSAMYFNGKVVTSPSSVGHVPRYLPNAWVVVPKEGQKVAVYKNGERIS